MEKQTILRFFIPIAFLTSIYSGPVYNLLLFLNSSITLESYWSIYTTPLALANLMTLSFILFAITFIVSLRFADKLSKMPIIILAIIIIGYSCIFTGLIWSWELLILVFILTGVSIAFITPIVINMISENIFSGNKNPRYKLALPISALVWIFISSLLFAYIGATAWRILYFVTGIINILSTPLINTL